MERYEQILQSSGADCILSTADVTCNYFSGYYSSNAAVVLFKDEKLYFTDNRYLTDAKTAAKGFTVAVMNDIKSVFGVLLNRKVAKIACDFNVPYREYVKLTAAAEGYETVDITDSLETLRRIKSDYEIECIKRAQSIAETAFYKTLPLITEGITERRLKAILEYNAADAGGDKMSFDTIIAFGENSACPHAVSGDRPLKKGMPILMDYGVKYLGYCSDMTRTVAFGNLPDKLSEIYDAVYKTNCSITASIKAGDICSEIDAAARSHPDMAPYSDKFIHSLGHGVGLEIHELPRLSSTSNGVLQVGEVVTVEPGIYIEGLGGVRIEDMVLIGKGRSFNLTQIDKKLITIK